MSDFVPGQRVLSETESSLGLGIVTNVDERTVQVLFPAVEEDRHYARQNSPLYRVRFKNGDQINTSDDETLHVINTSEENGLLLYHCVDEAQQHRILPETRLAHHLSFNQAPERLFNGQIDDSKCFQLRYLAWQQQKSSATRLPGFAGARIQIVAHQLYIADRVGKRHAPRVLLADEVGLGKTIEACLILKKQLLSGMAERVLIIVPEALVNQWYVELRRRFYLYFRIFDQAQWQAIADSGWSNPFESEQLVLCSRQFLHNDADHRAQALAGQWDIVVVDEAHHINLGSAAGNNEFDWFSRLSRRAPGLLLLTATPEQFGERGHFNRLRLLDPDRFQDYAAFVAESPEYKLLSQCTHYLERGEPLPENYLSELENAGINPALLDELTNFQADTRDPGALLSHLVDCHGTGRVFFRNTRRRIQGFPGRILHQEVLDYPKNYAESMNTGALQDHLYPETQAEGEWTGFDTRCDWLLKYLLANQSTKTLLICHRAQTVIELQQFLYRQSGIHCAIFHEGMSIIERDRSAAYFTQKECGSPLLLCSELGSEGRNFQFCQHLILFDLPLHPDLLEQRIGRLDRIGQTGSIHLHVPIFRNSPQQRLLQWFDDALDVVEHMSPAAATVFAHTEKRLVEALSMANTDEFLDFLEQSRLLKNQLELELENGRDHLLEISSFNENTGNKLARTLRTTENIPELKTFLELQFDIYGVEIEEESPTEWLVRPGNHMLLDSFPGLPEDGFHVTFERSVALQREELEFMSIEHPLAIAGRDLIINDVRGKACVVATNLSTCPVKDRYSGQLLLEGLYKLNIALPKKHRFQCLNDACVERLLIANDLAEHDRDISHDHINNGLVAINPGSIQSFVSGQQRRIESLLHKSELLAEQRFASIKKQLLDSCKKQLVRELGRLNYLRTVNPSVRQSEIDYLANQLEHVESVMASAWIELDAIRLVVVA